MVTIIEYLRGEGTTEQDLRIRASFLKDITCKPNLEDQVEIYIFWMLHMCLKERGGGETATKKVKKKSTHVILSGTAKHPDPAVKSRALGLSNSSAPSAKARLIQ